MKLKTLFRWLCRWFYNYNLFAPEVNVNDDDTDEPQEPTVVIKRQKYTTWVYILFLIVSIYVTFFIAFMAPQPKTVTISDVTYAKFNQVYIEHGEIPPCPCSTTSVPYKTFIFHNTKFHPVCSSFFVSEQWIEALYLLDASAFSVLDFRKTAHSQFKLLAKLCSISKDIILQSQLNLDHDELISIDLIPEEQVRSKVMAAKELLQNSAIVRTISFINYLKIVTRANYFISALNSHFVLQLSHIGISGKWTQFHMDLNSTLFTDVACDNANPIEPAGFYMSKNDSNDVFNEVENGSSTLGMANGFFAGCTVLEALLQSTLDCLYDVECLQSLSKFFPNLAQMDLNWSAYILTEKKQNLSLNDHLPNIFLEDWSTEINYKMYFDECAPLFCRYTTVVQSNFIYAFMLLISLYGGMVLILRLIAPCVVNIVWKFKYHSQNIRINSAYFKTYAHKLAVTLKRLNLFKKENERTEDEINQQRIITRLYLMLLFGAFLILVLFNSLATQTTTTYMLKPSLKNFTTLHTLYRNTLRCPCSTMTIPYHKFISLSPTLHQVCSSDFVSERWLFILMSIKHQIALRDWRSGASSQFQLLSNLCHLANKTMEDALRRFITQSFVSAYVLTELDFNTQLNTTLVQFFKSTTIYFGQLVHTVHLLMRVDQPFIHQEAITDEGLSNVFLSVMADETTGEPTWKVELSFPLTYDTNTSDVNCICTSNSHCQSLVAIYDGPEPEPAYTIPGMFSGCFVIDSLMLSTLECFYSNSNCLPIVSKYIREIYNPPMNYPQSFNVQPLIYHPTTNNFTPNATIRSIVNKMMIEAWNPLILYDQYYELCDPDYCAYSETVPAKKPIEVVVTVISTIGGLCVSLSLITPYIIRIVQYIFKLMRKRQRLQQQPEVQQEAQQEQGRLKWFDRLKTMIDKWIRFLYAKLTDLNLFAMRTFGNNIERMTAKRLGQWTTRLYFVLLLIGMAVLLLNTIIQPQVLTKTFDEPSFDLYQDLKQIHGDGLQCSCSLIASKYDHFVKIEPVFHQICSSVFVSNGWQSNLTADLDPDLFMYSFQDYRRFLAAHLQYLTGLCEVSAQAVNNSVDQFLSSLLITSQLLSETAFHARLNSQIKQSRSNAPVIFNQHLALIGSINDGNAIISAYQTNFEYIYPVTGPRDAIIETQAILYDSNCSCGLHQNCTTQANFIETEPPIIVSLKGLKMGCIPSEAFHASTLECFYDSSCLALIQEHVNYANHIESISINGSRFSVNTTVAQLINDLFTETWETTRNYSSYYDQCAPAACSYTYSQKLNSLDTLTTLLGLLGGLSTVLKWICPKIVQIIFKIYQRRIRRRNIIQPVSIIPTETVVTSTSIPAYEISQNNVPLSIRCSMKISFICTLLFFVIAGLATFSIYFIGQANNRFPPTISLSNTSIDVNLNTTTTSVTTLTTSTAASACKLTFQPIALHIDTDYMYVPLSFIVADFNSNGQSDLATIFTHRTKNIVRYVTVMLGNGNGSFGPQMRLAKNDFYNSIAAGDFNNDKNVDLVLHFDGLYMAIFLGNGDGTFQERLVIRVTQWSSGEMIVAEFNNDGYLDIVVNCHAVLWLFFGNGNGSFTEATIDTNYGGLSIDYGDFNNDNYLDIVTITTEYHYITVFLGYGNRTFKAQKKFFFGNNIVSELTAVGDLDADGRLDVIFSYKGEHNVIIVFGYGDGNLGEKQNFLIGTQSTSVSSIAISDLNEDGFADVILCESNPYGVYILYGNGNQIFEMQTILSTKSQYPFTFNIAVADFNSDNHQDLIVTSDADDFHSFTILLNTCECCKKNLKPLT